MDISCKSIKTYNCTWIGVDIVHVWKLNLYIVCSLYSGVCVGGNENQTVNPATTDCAEDLARDMFHEKAIAKHNGFPSAKSSIDI